MSLILKPEQREQIERDGMAAYPNECCGAMLGRDFVDASGTTRRVTVLRKLTNSFVANERYHRFSLDAKELMDLEKEAGEMKLMVLGFYHSHPDAPARPSEYDRQHAWPFYSYVIVSIENGQAKDLTSWQLDAETEHFKAETVQVERTGK
jgi:proteasome lid subunit RPN8/RPN11